uniref:C2H2-type domain-containing protein n=1 Tax=Sphaeramia orbicularis TaxID=375764 RepID=A0A673BXS9_9TELE
GGPAQVSHGRPLGGTALQLRHLREGVQDSEQKEFSCGICGKSFHNKYSFSYHQRSHTGEKPFVCDVCGKRFFQASSLKQHERIHTGEKPYKCEQCGKAFRTDGNFYRHMRIHTGEKPFECPCFHETSKPLKNC